LLLLLREFSEGDLELRAASPASESGAGAGVAIPIVDNTPRIIVFEFVLG
jgi:hypothetical protein